MSIATAITAAQGRVADCYTAISNKGGTLPATQNLSNMPTAIASIPVGTPNRFGTSVASYVGVVDSSGKLKMPEEQLNGITFTGVEDIAEDALYYKFYRNTHLTGTISFPDLTTISGGTCCYQCFGSTRVTAISFPKLTTISGSSCCYNMFNNCTSLTSVSFPELTTVSGNNALNGIFAGCIITSASFPKLETISSSYGFSSAFSACTSLTTTDFSALKEISGSNAMGTCFNSCSELQTISFNLLETLTGGQSFRNAFRYCGKLSSISFPSLKTTSFGNVVNQFENMFNSSTASTSGSCTVHFPSNLQSTISGLSGYPTFGGNSSRIVLAFDLTATS